MLSISSLILLHAWRCRSAIDCTPRSRLDMAPTVQVQRQAAVAVIARHHGTVTSVPAQRTQHSTPSASLLGRQYKAQEALVVRKAGPARRLATAAVVAKAGGEVLVAGATGQTAARIVLQLARAGYKVTAGVSSLRDAEEAIDFAKRVELLQSSEAAAVKAVELDLGDADSLKAALPKRGGRVVVVAGDIQDGRRADPKQAQRAVAALAANGNGLAQLVLVTPVGGVGGTGIFNLGKPRPGALSKLEEQLVESGVNYVIVRTASSERVTDSYAAEANPVVTGLGALPEGLSVSRSQVAAVVAAALSQARSNAIVEVGADPEAEAAPLEDLVEQVLATQAAEQAEQQQGAEQVPVLGSLLKNVGGSSSRRQQAREVVEADAVEEDGGEPAPAKRGGGGGLFGTLRLTKPSKAAEPEPEEQEQGKQPAARKQPAFSFGTLRLNKQQASEQAAEEKPAKRGGLFGARQARQEPQEEEAKPAKRGGLFGGAKRPAAGQEQEKAAPKARTVRGRNPLPATEEKKPARGAKQQAAPQAKKGGEQPPKKGGLLQALGISQETVYVDEA